MKLYPCKTFSVAKNKNEKNTIKSLISRIPHKVHTKVNDNGTFRYAYNCSLCSLAYSTPLPSPSEIVLRHAVQWLHLPLLSAWAHGNGDEEKNRCNFALLLDCFYAWCENISLLQPSQNQIWIQITPIWDNDSVIKAYEFISERKYVLIKAKCGWYKRFHFQFIHF